MNEGRVGPGVRAALLIAAIVAGAGGVRPAFAVGFSTEDGDVTGSWDTTLSYGLAWRLEDRDPSIIGTANGGTAFSVNGDDGNLNFGRGLFSNALKLTSELELKSDRFGMFVRVKGFYDFELENGDTDRTPLTPEALDRVGSRADVLDAFGWVNFNIGKWASTLRLGNQVVSWGESTFIQNSINTINHFDVAALRLPGAELRDALLPQQLAWLSVNFNENLSAELVYQFDWNDTEPEPVGSYFAFNDFVPDGGDTVFLAFGDVRDIRPQVPFEPCELCPAGSSTTPSDHLFQGVSRAPTPLPEDDGQGGAALRWFLPGLNNGTELGFYYYQYHSRLPLISAITGTPEGLQGAATISAEAAVIAGATAQYLAANPGDFTGAIEAGSAAAGPGIPDYVATGIAAAAATGPNTATVARAYAVDLLGATSHYFTSFPEDIQLFGLSFNTQVGETAVQGEYSLRQDVPLQIDDLEILFAALSPISDALAQGQLGSFSFNPVSPQFNPNTPPGTTIVGYKRMDMSQFQFTLTRITPPLLGASQGVVVFEGAMSYVHDMPEQDELRFEGPGTYVSGNALVGPAAHPGKPIESSDHFADATSWGYRLAGRLDFMNAVGPVNLFPYLSWQHDVTGISPTPGGNFLEGRQALTLGLRTSYQNTWEGEVSFTTFNGASRYNLINDRDFLSISAKYSF
jgi:hypothetical protein